MLEEPQELEDEAGQGSVPEASDEASMHQSKLTSQHKLCISDFCNLTIP